MWAVDCISIFGTIVSIASAIYSFSQAKKARRYKKQVSESLGGIKVIHYCDIAHDAILRFVNSTRRKDWNKGKAADNVFSEINKVLLNLNTILPSLSDSERKDLIDKRSQISSLIQFIGISDFQKKSLADLLIYVDRILQEVRHNKLSNIIDEK
jgi:hypothetical protein